MFFFGRVVVSHDGTAARLASDGGRVPRADWLPEVEPIPLGKPETADLIAGPPGESAAIGTTARQGSAVGGSGPGGMGLPVKELAVGRG